MGQSERSELITNRRPRGADDTSSNILRREDLNSGQGTAEKLRKDKPLQMSNYLEVIDDESEDNNHHHVVHLMQERSNSFFIDGSVA